MPLQFPRILVAELAVLASQYNQALLRRAKDWITSSNAIFEPREPPVVVPVAAHPQVLVLLKCHKKGVRRVTKKCPAK